MWTKTFSKVYQGVKKEHIWKHWTNINDWPKWHSDIDYCKFEDEFKVGSSFKLKPKGGPIANIKLIEVDEGRTFTDCTKFLGAKMYNTHVLEETNQGLRITNTTTVTGMLKYLWVKIVAENVAASAEKELDELVKLAKVTG